jgi:penicillin-binding protein 2
LQICQPELISENKALRTSEFDPLSLEIFDRQLKKVTCVVLAVFAALILRFWFLQVVNGSMYRTKSESNRIHLQDIPPFRGMILDRNGAVFVDNRPSYDLYVVPEEVHDLKALLQSLSGLAGLGAAEIEEKLDEAPLRYPFRPVCIKRDLSRDELAKVETHRFNLPGIIIKVAPQRYYVNGTFASHLIGYLGEINENQLSGKQYTGSKPGDLIGKSGVEWKWQHNLNGVRGGAQVEVDATGRQIRVMARKNPVPGENVCLTIDKDLQAVAEKALAGKSGAAVAMDPNNGEILALASSPSFDPNLFVGGIDKASWEGIVLSGGFPLQNRALAGQYPPGSVFKILVALAGLEEGIIDPEEELVCTGIYYLGRRGYRCWKKYGHGVVNLHRALVESCDVYFYEMGQRLGIDKISEYALRFGLGKRTGFDPVHEKAGLIPTRDWKLKRWGVPWQGGETLSTAIGQSFVLVTPIQMAAFVSAVFNGGIVYKPQVTKWVGKSETEKVHEFSPVVTRKVGIKQENLALVKNALIGVVNAPHGTGGRARLKEVTVAGKTGTSQVVARKKEEEFEREEDIPVQLRDHAWFVAVAPAENPRIAVAVVVEHGGHGGSAAAPIAGQIIKAYIGMGRPVVSEVTMH